MSGHATRPPCPNSLQIATVRETRRCQRGQAARAAWHSGAVGWGHAAHLVLPRRVTAPLHAVVDAGDGRQRVQAQAEVVLPAAQIVHNAHTVAALGQVQCSCPAAVAIPACVRRVYVHAVSGAVPKV